MSDFPQSESPTIPSPSPCTVPRVVADFAKQINEGRYELGREIGHGGMGKILEAVDKPLRRSVALKVLVRRGDEESQKRFIREARITGELQHPSIVPVHELNVDEKGELFYTMKLVRGVTLLEILRGLARQDAYTLRRYPLSALLTIFQKVCDAVAFAHSQSEPVIHRDLKPENIMVGNYGEVLVMDWGAAKILPCNAGPDESPNSAEAGEPATSGEPTNDVFLTQAGSVMGTPGYMAPEQARGDTASTDERTDIYALGAILYALLTLEAPVRLTRAEAEDFAKRSQDGKKLTNEFYRQVTPLVSDRSARQKLDHPVPDSLVHVVLKAMALRPDDRYPTVKKLQADVAAYQSGFATSAEEARPWKRLKLLVARHKVLFSAITTILIILLAATIISLRERKVALDSNTALQLALHRASFADHESARQYFRDGQWRRGLTLMGRALSFWPENQAAADYLLSAILFGQGDADRLPLFGDYHSGPVYEAEFSPDSTRFVTASYDGTVQVWDVATGAPVLQKPLQHSGPVNCVRFSPDGRKILTTGEDGFARIWDAQNGTPLARPMEHGKPALDEKRVVETGVFSPDGKRVLTASWDHTARVWNAETGEQIAELVHPHRVASAVFSPDGSRILACYWYGGAMLWDAATFQQIGAPMQHGATVRKGLFSPDGRRVATASLDKTARIWDAQTGQPLCEPLRHPDQVWSLAISPDGHLLATACYDGTARLWSLIDGSPVGTPMKHDGPVDTVAFSPDGARMVTASRDKTVRRWDVRTCKEIGERMRHDDAVFKAIFSPNGSKVLSVSWDHAAYLWNARSRDWPGEKLPVPEHVRLAEFMDNPQQIFVATSNGHTGVWSLSDDRFITPLVDHGGELVTGAVARSKDVFATAGTDNVVRFWRSSTGAKLGQTPNQGSPISAIAFSTDGSSLFTAYLGGLVLQCSVPAGRPLGKPITHPEYIDAIAVAPSGKEIATGCRDDFMRFWDPQTGKPTRHDIRHDNPVLSISYHPDGKTIATGCADYTARIWSLQTSEQLGPALPLNGPVTSVRYIRSGRALLAASNQDTEVNCYDSKTHNSLYLPLPHPTGVSHITSNLDGSLVITVTNDGVARLWRIPTTSESPPKWLPEYIRALGGLAFTSQQQLVQAPTRQRLELRKKLLSLPPENTTWDKLKRWSFEQERGPLPLP